MKESNHECDENIQGHDIFMYGHGKEWSMMVEYDGSVTFDITFCPFCREELPEIKCDHAKLHARIVELGSCLIGASLKCSECSEQTIMTETTVDKILAEFCVKLEQGFPTG